MTIKLHFSSVLGIAKTPPLGPGDPGGRGKSKPWSRNALIMTTASSDGGIIPENCLPTNSAKPSGTQLSQTSRGISTRPTGPKPRANTSSLIRCISNLGDVESCKSDSQTSGLNEDKATAKTRRNSGCLRSRAASLPHSRNCNRRRSSKPGGARGRQARREHNQASHSPVRRRSRTH